MRSIHFAYRGYMHLVDSRISARALAHALGGWRTREPAYEALADGIRLLCLDSRLAVRTALPSERELASALHLSRTTVTAAYRMLRDSGHITSVRGSGSVTASPPGREPSYVSAGAGAVDLQQASPAAWPGLAGVLLEVAADTVSVLSRPGYDVVGSAELREAVSEHYARQGIKTTPEDVLITNGAQSAIHLLASVLLTRGDRVVVETPTYPHAVDALRDQGARLVALPVSMATGWDLERAAQIFDRARPSLAYLMPRYHNPTGRSMTAQEEAAITLAASRARTSIVVDDTLADLRIDGPSYAPAFADADVIRVGSLGKTAWGGLRIGWVRAPRDIVRALASARRKRDLGTPEFEQRVASTLLPQLPQLTAHRAHTLRLGRDAALSAFAETVPQWNVPSVEGGTNLWVELDAPLASGLVLAAREAGIFLSAGPRFSVDGGFDAFIRVPFTLPPEDLARAVRTLGEVWPRVQSRSMLAPATWQDALV